MSRCFCLVLVLMLTCVFTAEALCQSRQDMLPALKGMQTLCESGAPFDSYAAAVDDLQARIGQYLNSREADNNPAFADKIERALIAYQSAFLLWKSRLEFRQERVRIDHPTIQYMLSVYPASERLFDRSGEAPVNSLITFFWEQADARIAEASRLASGRGR